MNHKLSQSSGDRGKITKPRENPEATAQEQSKQSQETRSTMSRRLARTEFQQELLAGLESVATAGTKMGSCTLSCQSGGQDSGQLESLVGLRLPVKVPNKRGSQSNQHRLDCLLGPWTENNKHSFLQYPKLCQSINLFSFEDPYIFLKGGADPFVL